MSQEVFWILFSKKIAGEASPEELTQFENLVKQYPEWQYAVQSVEDMWKNTAPQSNAEIAEAEDAYMLHLQRMQEKNIEINSIDSNYNTHTYTSTRKVSKRVIKIVSISAIAASMVFGVYAYLQKSRTNLINPAVQLVNNVNEISTRFGSKSKVQLPDGSIVWLNAGSRLVYDKSFGIEKRVVEMSGEGFFDVTKDLSKPFIIKTKSFEIKVLGTVFNVKAYPEDETSEASLLEGQIEVSIKSRPNDKIILSPKEKLVVENTITPTELNKSSKKQEPLVVISKLKYSSIDSSVAEVQWKDNILVFDDERMEDVALKMGRWFDVEIEISEELLKQKRLTGKFENESIEQALEALSYTSTDDFTFKRIGRKITIYKTNH